MIIQEDTRQKPNAYHNQMIERYFRNKGIEIVKSKIIVGDYCIPNATNISIDSKSSILELYQDVVHQHDRFRNELLLAQRCNIMLYIVVPNAQGISSIDELVVWKNPLNEKRFLNRADVADNKRPPVSNQAIIKTLKTIENKYGCKFIFCPTNCVGEIILDLLVSKPITNAF